jgi:hypothetical protein
MPTNRVAMALDNPVKELVRLIELDYSRSSAFIDGLVQREAAIRGLTITVWTALLGIALDRQNWAMGGLSVLSTAAFAFLDAHYSTLFMQAQEHVIKLEEVSGLYYRSLALDEEYAKEDFDSAVHTSRFGLYRDLRPVNVKALGNTIRQRRVFRSLYPPLVFISLACVLQLLLS